MTQNKVLKDVLFYFLFIVITNEFILIGRVFNVKFLLPATKTSILILGDIKKNYRLF